MWGRTIPVVLSWWGSLAEVCRPGPRRISGGCDSFEASSQSTTQTSTLHQFTALVKFKMLTCQVQESCSRHLFTVLLIITVHQAAKACYLLECSLNSFPLFLKGYSCIIDGHGHFPQGIIPVKLNITVQIFGAAWITDLTPWLIWTFIICHSLWSYKYRYCIYALQFIGKEYIPW